MFTINRLVVLSHARSGSDGRPRVFGYRSRVLHRGAAVVWVAHPQLRPESGRIVPLERVALEVGVARGVVTFPAVVRQVGVQQGVPFLGLTLDGAPVPAQRRRHSRARMQLSATVHLAGVALPCVTQDLGVGGCGVVLADAALALPVGVAVSVGLPGMPCALRAALVRRDRGVHAMAFTDLGDDARAVLERLVTRQETEARRLQVIVSAGLPAPPIARQLNPSATIPVEAML